MANTRNSRGVGIHFPPDTLSQIDALAEAQKVSRAEIVRRAIGIGLPLFASGLSPDFRRLIVILENLQLSLSLLMEREYGDQLEALIDKAHENVERFHG